MPFSEIVYRGQGPYQRKGGGFSTLGVHSEEDLAAALAAGWYRTLPEAIEAHDLVEAMKAASAKLDAAPVPTANRMAIPIEDDAPPTRAEIEAKCKGLGIKVHHRSSDKTLLALIDAALKARA